MQQKTDLHSMVHAYLQCFEARDLSQCMDFFAEDANLIFYMGSYRGREDIEQWHRDRFAADFRVIRIDKIEVQGDTVTVNAVATSNRLNAWRLGSLSGTATFSFNGGKIKDVKFGLRKAIPIEDWH